MTKIHFLFVALIVVSLNQSRSEGGSQVREESSDATALESTIRRHFDAIGGYKKGDLISRSQVEEPQDYLRKTGRKSAATHPKLLHRVLPDDSRLCKLFYSKNGSEVLREAARKLGGYAPLEEMSRTTAGHVRLVEAVKSRSADAVLKLFPSISEESKESVAVENQQKSSARRKLPIYTVNSFIEAVLPSSAR